MEDVMGGACGMYGEKMHRGFWWGNLKERDSLEDLGVDGRGIIKWILNKEDMRSWIGLIWLKNVTISGLL
jgi:hypothetical protein